MDIKCGSCLVMSYDCLHCGQIVFDINAADTVNTSYPHTLTNKLQSVKYKQALCSFESCKRDKTS